MRKSLTTKIDRLSALVTVSVAVCVIYFISIFLFLFTGDIWGDEDEEDWSDQDK